MNSTSLGTFHFLEIKALKLKDTIYESISQLPSGLGIKRSCRQLSGSVLSNIQAAEKSENKTLQIHLLRIAGNGAKILTLHDIPYLRKREFISGTTALALTVQAEELKTLLYQIVNELLELHPEVLA
jgi:hypothetical protein